MASLGHVAVGMAAGRLWTGLQGQNELGLGIALLWPFSNERFFAPWTPIPVAPIGARMLTDDGLRVVMTEALQFAPLLVWAVWRRRRSSP